MRAARRYATWYLGYPEWADNILHAYNNPEAAMKQIDGDKAQYE
jgi:hypothetical protein